MPCAACFRMNAAGTTIAINIAVTFGFCQVPETLKKLLLLLVVFKAWAKQTRLSSAPKDVITSKRVFNWP